MLYQTWKQDVSTSLLLIFRTEKFSVVGSCPRFCRMVGNIPSVYPLGVYGAHPSTVTPKMPPDVLREVPWGENRPGFENRCSKRRKKPNTWINPDGKLLKEDTESRKYFYLHDSATFAARVTVGSKYLTGMCPVQNTVPGTYTSLWKMWRKGERE